LDELEKANRDIWSVLLQIMEEGVLTDAQGRRTDFRNVVLMMTSNLGAKRFAQGPKLGFAGNDPGAEQRETERAALRDAQQTFAPEFWNRLDGALVFHPLDEETLQAITRQLLDETGRRLARLGVGLNVEPGAAELLARKGGGREYGARPLRRAVAKWVEDPVAELLLSGAAKSGTTLTVSAVGEEIKVTVSV
jgi:ATP-dependent Clp protease ATP-binding subunit ClpC